MEEATVREEKFHIYLNDDEYSRVIQTLIRLKNSLISQGRYTDGVDDVLCKVLSTKKRKLKKYFTVGAFVALVAIIVALIIALG